MILGLTLILCLGRIPEQSACPMQTELQDIWALGSCVESKCRSRLAARKTGGPQQLSSMIGGGQTLRMYSHSSGDSESVITHSG